MLLRRVCFAAAVGIYIPAVGIYGYRGVHIWLPWCVYMATTACIYGSRGENISWIAAQGCMAGYLAEKRR